MKERITSLDNPKIKQVLKLREARNRKKENLVLIEGEREIGLALKAGLKLETFFYCPELAEGEVPALEKNLIFSVSPAVFRKISYRENPDGFLALARPLLKGLRDLKLGKNPLLIVLEGVEKPGNLGAVLRSADAAGADGIIVTGKTEIYNPNAIRSSQGTVFTNQIALAGDQETIAWLKERKIKIFATTPAGDKTYVSADFSGPAAIVMGAEDKGLSKTWLEAAEERVKIEMRGLIDSLNVSVSLAIILFEALRQRHEK